MQASKGRYFTLWCLLYRILEPARSLSLATPKESINLTNTVDLLTEPQTDMKGYQIHSAKILTLFLSFHD